MHLRPSVLKHKNKTPAYQNTRFISEKCLLMIKQQKMHLVDTGSGKKIFKKSE